MKTSPLLAIAQRLNTLGVTQQQAFRQKLAQQGINSWQLPIVVSNQDRYPLSLAQQRFLVAEKMTGRAIYNLCSVIKFDLQLDVSRLEETVNDLINRHQVMTTFFQQDKQGHWYPKQLKEHKISIVPEVLSITQQDEALWLNAYFEQVQAYQFDLGKEVPFKVKLVKHSEHYYVFFTIHHVAFDAWSFDVFNQELFLLYQAKAQQKIFELPPLPIQYQDYAQWQNQWLQSDDFIRQQDYWQHQLANLPEPLSLPFDYGYKQTKHRNYDGQVTCLELDKNLSLALRKTINNNGSTLYVYLQTAFSWLLAKYSSQSDFCFGSSIANRQRSELNSLVGPLLNTLVIRHRILADQSFNQALNNCQKTVNEAFDNQDYPYEKLAKCLQKNDPQVNTSQVNNQQSIEPLFRVMFIHVGLANNEQIILGDSTGSIVTPEQNNARFDLSLRITEQADQGVSLDLEFSTELFRPATITQLLGDYNDIITKSVATPDITFSELILSSPVSRLVGPTLTETLIPLNETITRHALGNGANKVALFDGKETITYQALNKYISHAESWLRSQALSCQKSKQAHQVNIAIVMPRTSLQVVLMLASWRLGYVCLMLDPRQPLARLNSLCNDAQVSLIMSDTRYGFTASTEIQLTDLSNIAPAKVNISLNVVDDQLPDVALEVLSKVSAKVSSQVALKDSAYILYTSGSTGKPKGIVVNHQAVSHYAAAISQQYPLPIDSRWLTLATVAADLGLTSVLAALYQGQCLLLPSNDVIFDPNALAQFLQEYPTDCLKITPSHLNALLSVENPQRILPKKCLFLGGEGLNQTLFDTLKQLSPELSIINHYGPSESTVGITSNLLGTDLLNVTSQVAPLGTPLPGNEITLRNNNGDIVPYGALGELCVSSPQLASGYWHNKSLTNTVFITTQNEHVFDIDSQSSYYKTGDLARLNHHGLLEFMGRSDDQIKRRGYRIELDEITNWLCAQPEINTAITLMVSVKIENEKSTVQKEQLVTWFQLTAHSNEESDSIITHIKARTSNALPIYMLPDQWVKLDNIPLNNNGKIDRNTLPIPSIRHNIHCVSDDDLNTDTSKVNNIEQRLTAIWLDLLKVKEVNAHDDFFALGGDSIMSLQLIGLAAKQGLKLTPRQILQHTTLRKMAASTEEILSPVVKHCVDKVITLFQKVLSIDNVSGHDNFFTLGGDSILSLQFIALAKHQALMITPKQLIDNPTPTSLAKLIEAFNQSFSQSFSQKKSENDINDLDTTPTESIIKPVDTNVAQPLTAAQQRILFLQQLTPSSTAYNLPAIFNVIGSIDKQKLLMASQALVEKHLMLRVKYIPSNNTAQNSHASNNNTLQQVINSYQPLTIHTELTPELALMKAQQRAQHCFDLSQGQILAIDLIPCTEAANIEPDEKEQTNDRFILVFNIHHIATDGWSMGLLIQDLLQLYQTSSASIKHANKSVQRKQSDQIKSDQINYLDWSHFQHQKADDKNTTDYWLTRLNNMPHQLELSFDKALPSQQGDQGATKEWVIPSVVLNTLDDYAKDLNTTPFSLLLAGFQLLMWRYSGQEDFGVGIPVSGREEADVQHIVGVFINTLINRALISPEQSTEQWLMQMIKHLQNDLSQQSMPLEKLLGALNPTRNMARPPVFQVVFNYQNDQLKQRTIALPDVSFTPIEHTEINTKFELSFNLLRRNGLSLQIEYNKDLFHQDTITQLFEDYLAIVDWLPHAKNAAISSLPMMSSDKALSLATSTTDDQIITDVDDFVYRFEQQVRTQPEAIAVIDDTQSYRYKTMNEKANQLAYWLLTQHFAQRFTKDLNEELNKGIAKDQLIAFCLPRNYQMLVTLIAIQKVGAAYLPLDSEQPLTRLSFIIEHAKPTLCLVDFSTESLLPTTSPIINLDKENSLISNMPKNNLCLKVDPKQLAYTLYTSGSTGKPKGVEIERGNFSTFLRAIETIAPTFNTILALTTITFDIAGLELCLPLVKGACVVIATAENQRDNEQLAAIITKHTIDLIQATPATWRMLSELNHNNLHQNILANTHAICGGEVLSTQLAEQLTHLCKSVTNVYGPTETTVWSSYYQVNKHTIHEQLAHQTSSTNVPIGRPLPNNKFYVLNKSLSPVPLGVVGELYIGGESVARGYRHDNELTQHVFINHTQFGRLYKTGDLVKWLRSKQLSFIGREDFQLKHHGYRIEPGEIESALIQHPNVAQAVVTMQKQALVAHVVIADIGMTDLTMSDLAMTHQNELMKQKRNNQISEQDMSNLLHHYLSQHVPDYMVPPYFQYLAALPLNSNGKVERSSLPIFIRQSNAVSDNALYTEHEEKLATIWRDLLNVDHVGIHDNFFRLGGHSLLATQLKARLNTIGLNIPLKNLFESRTLAEQAKLLTNIKYQTIPFIHDLNPVPSAIPLSNAQRRLWFMQQLNTRNTSFNMQTVVKITGSLQAKFLEKAIKLVTQQHAILQVVYKDNEGEPVQTFDPTVEVAFIEHVITEGTSQDIIDTQLDNAANYRFDLEKEAPLRVYLYQESKNSHLCQLVQHHIASDAWSMTLMLDHLMNAYQEVLTAHTNLHVNAIANSSTKPSINVGTKPSYLDYAYWQNTPEIIEKQATSLQYWRQTLAGASTILSLPFDNERSQQNKLQGDVVNLVLSTQLLGNLNTLAHQQHTSLFTLLLSAFATLIYQQTKAQDIIIGTDVANREHHQTQDMLGFFVNLLPLRIQPKATRRFNDFLQQVKRDCLNSFEHQSVPFDHIVEAIKPERLAGMHPLIQVLFVMQNTPDSKPYSGDLSITPHETTQHHAKFDCALFVNEQKSSSELLLNWVFNRQLFNKSTIEKLSQSFVNLLEAIVCQPSAPLNSLLTHKIIQTNANKENNQTMSPIVTRPSKLKKLSKLSKLSKLKKTESPDNAIEIKPLTANRPFPLLVECKRKSLDPLTWARKNQQQIMTWLESHGGIVFRGFNLPTALEFEQFCLAIYPELYAMYGDLPKNDIGSKIYKSTPYPSEQMIMYHNESSHQSRWPRRQWFYCSQNADVGGATPIVDCREMYQRLPEPIRSKLEQKRLCYVRNFSNLDVSWQHFFKTEDRLQVEELCTEGGIEYEWYGEDNLRTSQVCPAVITHPITKEKSFFNQIQLHHYSFLESDVQQHLLETTGQDNLPRNVFYGDGTPLEQAVIELISALYETCAVRFNWQIGDVVMLDNMLAAHARDPFQGERKIAVAMGDIYQSAPEKNVPPIAVLTKEKINTKSNTTTNHKNNHESNQLSQHKESV